LGVESAPLGANPNYGGTPVTMLYAGDDAVAKTTAAMIARDLGFDPVDFGPLSGARLLEAFAPVWIMLAVRLKLGRDFTLNIIRRPSGG
jgi:predicted dinucleotide-binding enzyme